MNKFTFVTQPRYDQSHGNITYSVDSELSHFSFNICIIKMHVDERFQFYVPINSRQLSVQLSRFPRATRSLTRVIVTSRTSIFTVKKCMRKSQSQVS